MAFGGADAGVDRRHLDVFLGRARGDQVVALEHKTKGFAAQPGQFVAVQVRDVFPGEQVVAGAGAVKATEIEQILARVRDNVTAEIDDGDLETTLKVLKQLLARLTCREGKDPQDNNG